MTKTKNLTDQKHSSVAYGPDTSGCPIACLPDLIRKRAYELFEARGCQSGHELDDWLQAEREIKKHLSV
jgi:hypothetical protein